MTRAEACITLGISSSSSNSKAELVYKEKSKELQLQMVPGMPLETRQQAQTELVKVTSALHIVQISSPSIPHQAKQKARRKTCSRPKQTPHRPFWPQKTGQPVADFVGSIPLPKKVVVLIFILAMLTVVSMLRSCTNIRVSASTNTQSTTIDDRPKPLNTSTEDTKAQETTKDIQKIQKYQRKILI